MTPEGRLSKEVKDYLIRERIWFRRNQAQSCANGYPDIDFLYLGVYVGIELKVPGNKPTDLQVKKLNAINENGGIGKVVYSLKEVEELVNEIRRNRNDKTR